jgi:hypothetical protein
MRLLTVDNLKRLMKSIPRMTLTSACCERSDLSVASDVD